MVSSVNQLAKKLGAYLGGVKNIEAVHQGRVEPGNGSMTIIDGDDDMQEAIDRWIARKKLSKLLDLWIRGLHVDWKKLHGDVKPRRIPLPTYPFARERCWVAELTSGQGLEAQFTVDGTMKSIQDIIDAVGDDTVDTVQAVEALKMLV